MLDKEFIEQSEVVNQEGYGYYNAFLLALGSYGEHKFIVYSNELDEALEILGEYCKDKGYTGLLEFNYGSLLEFWDGDEDCITEHWFPVNGGEYYLQFPSYVKEVKP